MIGVISFDEIEKDLIEKSKAFFSKKSYYDENFNNFFMQLYAIVAKLYWEIIIGEYPIDFKYMLKSRIEDYIFLVYGTENTDVRFLFDRVLYNEEFFDDVKNNCFGIFENIMEISLDDIFKDDFEKLGLERNYINFTLALSACLNIYSEILRKVVYDDFDFKAKNFIENTYSSIIFLYEIEDEERRLEIFENMKKITEYYAKKFSRVPEILKKVNEKLVLPKSEEYFEIWERLENFKPSYIY